MKARAKILIVDDDENFKDSILDNLEDWGFEAASVDGKNAALEKLKADFFHAALVDLRLPDGSGLDILKEVRAAGLDTMVIVMTGNASLDTSIQAMNEGAFTYIVKPCNMDVVRLGLNSALEKQKLIFDNRRLVSRLRENARNERNKARELEKAYGELKKTQEQLLQARKLEAIGQLAAGVAHEINTPIQYIGDNLRFLSQSCEGFSELLRQLSGLFTGGGVVAGHPDVERLRQACRDIKLDFIREEIPNALSQSQEGVARVAKIVGAMKEFSHPGSMEKTFADLNHGIESAVLVCRSEWKYAAEVRTELDPNLPLVSCFPNELNQVFINLIVNATHAIAEKNRNVPDAKGLITIRSRVKGDAVEIDVADTGTGIPEAIRSRIFDPFFTTKEVGFGTGQGLSIAYAIVARKHKGAITFTTEVGRGSTFTVSLPLHAAADD